MTRKARSNILYDGSFAHIYSRALEKRRIFQDAGDFEEFKRLLGQTKIKYGFSIYHYCLMNTHFHLAAGVGRLQEFSRALKELKQNYAGWVLKRRKKVGPIWWGRFGSRVIEDERYLAACGLYIEMNPVEAGIVKRPEEWPYSSSRYYFLNQEDSLIDPYEQPSYENVTELAHEIKEMKGVVLGSELFRIHMAEGLPC